VFCSGFVVITFIKTHGAIFFNFSYIYFTLRNFGRNHSIFEQNCFTKVGKGDIFLKFNIKDLIKSYDYVIF